MTIKRNYNDLPLSTELLADTLKNVNPKLDLFVHLTFKGKQVLEIAENSDKMIEFIEEQERELKFVREDLSRKSLKEKVTWFEERFSGPHMSRTYDSEIILSICKDVLNDFSLEDNTKTSFIQLVQNKFPYIWIKAICESNTLSDEIFSEFIAAIRVVDKVQAETLQLVGKDNLNELPKDYRPVYSLKSSVSLDESLWSSDVSIEAKLSYINLVLDSFPDKINLEVAQKQKDILEEYQLIMNEVKSIIPLTDLKHSIFRKRASPTTHQYVIESCPNL